VELIQEILKGVMKKGEHYDVIPGCGEKKVLLKSGAEKLSLTFRLAPKYEVEEVDMGGGHRNFKVRCSLYHIGTGAFIGEGIGSCSTLESKYRYRKAEQTCPECGKPTIIKGKKDYGGGWLCFQKKGGCGAKFEDGDPRIENQNMGRVEYEDPADYWNTCLKMGKKRAHVDAILTATAASDIFTQDIDDSPELYGGRTEPVKTEQRRSEREESENHYDNPDDRSRAEIVQWCLGLAAGDVKQAKAILIKETAFHDKKKNEDVAGVSDTSKLSGKRLEIAHGKIRKLHEAWAAKQAEPEEPQNTPSEPSAEESDPQLPF
jgi:hypothetical protein